MGGKDLRSGQEGGQGSFILTFIASSIPASNCWSTQGGGGIGMQGIRGNSEAAGGEGDNGVVSE